MEDHGRPWGTVETVETVETVKSVSAFQGILENDSRENVALIILSLICRGNFVLIILSMFWAYQEATVLKSKYI